MKPPAARKQTFNQHYHGHTKSDDYAWLRDPEWQDVFKDPNNLSAEIRAHLDAENSYVDHVMAPLEDLKTKLFMEMRGRTQEDEATTPSNFGAYAWNVRYRKGDEHPLICRGARDSSADATQIILDGNVEAQGLNYFKLAAYEPSPCDGKLAWALDDNGSEYFIIRIRDIQTGADMQEQLHDTAGNCAWSKCGNYLFYVAVDENHRPHRIMRHKLGAAQSDDICVYEEQDAGFFISVCASQSQRLICISAHDHETSEAWVIDAENPESDAYCVATRRPGIQYAIEDDAARDRLIILTNWSADFDGTDGKADDFQIVTAPLIPESADQWTSIIAHEPGYLLIDAFPYQDHLVWIGHHNALPFIRILSYATGVQREISFPEEAYDLSVQEGMEYATSQLRFTYTSMTTPRQVYDYHMDDETRILRKTQAIPSGHNADDYITKRLWAVADDGARVPMSIIYHKDTAIDGSAPALLYGYGSYGITIPADFSVARLSLIDRGFIYAIAHIRGGKACGHNWFLQGRGKHKQNTFTDFIAAAHALIEQGYTKPGNISIHGGSAGGLLVGASLNLAPDQFCSALAEVPFVDVLTTMLDATLPLTPPEWPEWGNPILNKTDYETISAYSPYDNIREAKYPHIFATAGLTDPRVTYWEPAKWIARLREMRTDTGWTLLRTEMSAGHGGQAGRFNQLKEIAELYSFVLMCHNPVDHPPIQSDPNQSKTGDVSQ